MRAAPVDPFLRARAVEAPALRLVGFHHAGGSASIYRPLARLLPETWDVLLHELPGRGRRPREEPVTDLREAVAMIVAALEPWRDAPLVLWGHSLGAILAVETARALEAAGTPVCRVVVSGRVAPSGHAPTGLHELHDDALIEAVMGMGGLTEEIAEFTAIPAFRTLFLRAVRADFALTDSYCPGPGRAPLTCPLSAVTGADDPWASPDAMPAWAAETAGAFDHASVPGGHFYLLDDGFERFARTLSDAGRTPAGRGDP